MELYYALIAKRFGAFFIFVLLTALPCFAQAALSPRQAYGIFSDGKNTGFGNPVRYGYSAGVKGNISQVPFPRLSYVPLSANGKIWIGFSGESRVRNWFDTHPILGAYNVNNAGRFTTRNLYATDLHLGDHVRFFWQLINGDAGGWKVFGYNGSWVKDLDVQQLFVDLSGSFLGGKGGFIFGRQQFVDAPDYMLGTRETPNTPISWNGFRAYQFWHKLRLDGYYYVQTQDMHTGSCIFCDTENYHNRLYGINTSFGLKEEYGKSFLDLFWIGYQLSGHPAAVSYQNSVINGSTTRNNFGFRWHGQWKWMDYSVGGIYQEGHFHATNNHIAQNIRNVEAFSINGKIDLKLGKFLSPILGMQSDGYSGGNAQSANGPIGTYIVPFGPNTNYIDSTTSLTGSNLIDITPFFSFKPTPRIKIEFKLPVYWRYSAQDALYSYLLSGRYTFPRPYTGRWIGIKPEFMTDFKINSFLTWTQYASYFALSHDLREAGAHDTFYYQSNIVFHF